MLPVVALVGRPNVGKSTIFNTLLGSRDALVVDVPGTTRDRHFGTLKIRDKALILVDTGGIGIEESEIDNKTTEQSLLAIEQADAVVFVVSASEGLTPIDEQIANSMRGQDKPVFLVVNKIDGNDPWEATAEFARLGHDNVIQTSAKHKRGIQKLVDVLYDVGVDKELIDANDKDAGIKVCILGRPNVGKSTLTNRIIGEDRVIVMDLPGTTRDSIYIPFEKDGEKFTLIDTAGVRRKAKVKDTVEKFSILKALQAIERSHVALMVIDAEQGIADQDLRLLKLVYEAGKCLFVVVNKCDRLSIEDRKLLKREVQNRLRHIDYAQFHFVSALKGRGIKSILKDIVDGYKTASTKYSTSKLNKVLSFLVNKHQPKMVNGRRIKLRFANFGGMLPTTVVIHGNQLDKLPDSYKRYLAKGFAKSLELYASPVRLIFQQNDNPYN